MYTRTHTHLSMCVCLRASLFPLLSMTCALHAASVAIAIAAAAILCCVTPPHKVPTLLLPPPLYTQLARMLSSPHTAPRERRLHQPAGSSKKLFCCCFFSQAQQIKTHTFLCWKTAAAIHIYLAVCASVCVCGATKTKVAPSITKGER